MAAFIRKIKGFLFRHLGFAAGICLGAPGGFFPLLVGIVIGFLTDELRFQVRNDKAVVRYLENPGKAAFVEPSPGLAAYCALGVLLAAGSEQARGDTVVHNARRGFRIADKDLPTLETYCRLAAEADGSLNADLLAESLAARRGPLGDLPYLTECLEELAVGQGSEALSRRIREILAPRTEGKRDPWAILGLDRDTAMDVVKSTFRKLAVQFHPDSVRGLREDQQRQAADAFIKIQEAYKEIQRRRRNP